MRGHRFVVGVDDEHGEQLAGSVLLATCAALAFSMAGPVSAHGDEGLDSQGLSPFATREMSSCWARKKHQERERIVYYGSWRRPWA